MITVEGQLIVKYWPPEHLDEDDYLRRAEEEMKLSSTYDAAISRLEETKKRISEMSSGKASDATKETLEKTISGLIDDSAKSKASAGNLAVRGQSMFNLKNVLNSIAWGLHNFKAKVLTFFFGDPVTATAAVETAEAAAEAASGTAKASDEVAETVTTANVMKGLEVLSNLPDMLAPMVENLSPGDNTTAEMEGAELYDNKGNLLGTLGRDGALVPADPQTGMGGSANATPNTVVPDIGNGNGYGNGYGYGQPGQPGMTPQGYGQVPPQGYGQPGMPPQGYGQVPPQGYGQPGMQPQGYGQMGQPGMPQGYGQPGQPGQPGMPPQGYGQMGQGFGQMAPQQPQQPYYGPVYDQNGQVLNQLTPQQVFGGGQNEVGGYTPQGWGYMPGVPQELQGAMNQIGAQQMVNPASYGYNGTPQGLTDALVQSGQQMVAAGHPAAPSDLINRFTTNLSQLSESAAKLVGVVHEMFGVTPPDAEGTGDLGVGDEKSAEGPSQSGGGAGGGAPAGQQGQQQGGGEGASTQEGATPPEGEEPVAVAIGAEINGEPVVLDDATPENAAEVAAEPAAEPAPEPAPEPEVVVQEKSAPGPVAPRPLFKGSIDIETPLFRFNSSLEIGTHLTSGAAVPVLNAPPAFAPVAAAAPAAGALGGFGMGGVGAGMVGAASATGAGATATRTTSGSSQRVGVGSTAFDADAAAKARVNGGHGPAEVAPVVVRNNARTDHEMAGAHADDVIPVAPVEDRVLAMLPPLVARGARVLARITGEMTARGLSGPAAVAVYDGGEVVFSTADGLGAVVSSRPLAAVPLMDELASKCASGSTAAGDFIADWTGMDDPVTVMALAIEVGLIDRPEVLVTSQPVEDGRELPGGAQAIAPAVLAKVPPADVSAADADVLNADEVREIVTPVARQWQYPEVGLASADLVVQLRSRRWSDQDSGTALIATIWWLISRTFDALNDGDMVTATRLGLMVAGLPYPRG